MNRKAYQKHKTALMVALGSSTYAWVLVSCAYRKQGKQPPAKDYEEYKATQEKLIKEVIKLDELANKSGLK